jgi:peptide/nickel transport system substrate-binding protein
MLMLIVALLASCVAPARPAGTVVYASGSDLESANPIVTVHPLARQLQRYALFVTLARYDSLLRPAPYLARSWSWDSGRTTLSLRLFSGLRWHDGVATTAGDAAFTLDAARDPRTASPYRSRLADVLAVRALDAETLTITFAAPQAGFPSVLCELPLAPAHLLRSVAREDLRRAPFGSDPVGNGPFRFVERIAGQRWTFARNAGFPDSLGGPPALERLVVAVVDEPTTKFAGLVSGDLQVAGISPATAALAARDPSLRVLTYPTAFSTLVVFNTTRPPFDDERVRRAVGLSIDRERIVRAALAGFATPARGPVSDASPLAAALPSPRDTALADSLLDAAGWRRAGDGRRVRAGRAFDVELLTVGSGDNAIEQLVQADLRARGLTVRVRRLELGAFLAAARAEPRAFDLLVTGVPGDVQLSQLPAMFASADRGGPLDYSGYHDAALDRDFALAAHAVGDSARRAAWGDVQRRLVRTAPAVWLYHARGVQGISARLRNVVMDLRGEMPTVARWELAP